MSYIKKCSGARNLIGCVVKFVSNFLLFLLDFFSFLLTVQGIRWWIIWAYDELIAD